MAGARAAPMRAAVFLVVRMGELLHIRPSLTYAAMWGDHVRGAGLSWVGPRGAKVSRSHRPDREKLFELRPIGTNSRPDAVSSLD
ncbi:hypothetical protein GCM10010361_10200 [Streptomyces olivaceiscleroticus]|uniref:Integrase n=1 Tax=Streptomyces olivaceiscleroticus TaxID=68245 RepID=A0ABP3JBM5_9ACTN